MKKIQIGDVFEIETPKGNGYFQYVYHNKSIGQLIRILPSFYIELPNISALTMEKELYFVHFPLKAAYKQGIVKLLGNFELPNDLELPEKMRVDFKGKNGELSWHIVDYDTWKRESVKQLTKEQISLSPWEIWNDTLLIERMADDWTPEKWI